MNPSREGTVPILSEGDIVTVRKLVRKLAGEVGFTATDVTRIVTAASELTRNIYKYAGSGRMGYRTLDGNGKTGIELTFVDQGAGIEDIEQAMAPGFTTGNGLGMGLPGAKRLMDEMEIRSDGVHGTMVRIAKWTRR